MMFNSRFDMPIYMERIELYSTSYPRPIAIEQQSLLTDPTPLRYENEYLQNV